jgi:hypothetical protein
LSWQAIGGIFTWDSCGQRVSKKATYRRKRKVSLKTRGREVYCTQCGAYLADGSAFCGNCGTARKREDELRKHEETEEGLQHNEAASRPAEEESQRTEVAPGIEESGYEQEKATIAGGTEEESEKSETIGIEQQADEARRHVEAESDRPPQFPLPDAAPILPAAVGMSQAPQSAKHIWVLHVLALVFLIGMVTFFLVSGSSVWRHPLF